MTHESNLAAIRSRLGYPLPDAPSDPQVLQLLIDETMNFTASLNNTSDHWSVGKWTLTARAGQEDYLITAAGPGSTADFGRPFLVYTTDPMDAYHVRREIPMLLLQDVDRAYRGPQQTYSSLPHTAEVIVFYRSYENWYARLAPIPNETGQYVICYETNYDYGALGDVVGLTSFHHLLRVRTALQALPLAGWLGCTVMEQPEGWKLKVSALRDALLYDDERFTRQFDIYRSQSNREGIGPKRPWGGWDEGDLGMGVGVMASGWGW